MATTAANAHGPKPSSKPCGSSNPAVGKCALTSIVVGEIILRAYP